MFPPLPYFEAGTWIKVWSPELHVWHHGIVVFSQQLGETWVIHSTKDGGVQCTTFNAFVGTETAYTVRTPIHPYEASAVVKRAWSQVGHLYSLFFANCEHFASWAFTGEAICTQLQDYSVGLTLAGLTLLALRSSR